MRELADEWWWDSVWLWGGGRGGLRVDWLWWFGGPAKEEGETTVSECVLALRRPRTCGGEKPSLYVDKGWKFANQRDIEDRVKLSVLVTGKSYAFIGLYPPVSHENEKLG